MAGHLFVGLFLRLTIPDAAAEILTRRLLSPAGSHPLRTFTAALAKDGNSAGPPVTGKQYATRGTEFLIFLIIPLRLLCYRLLPRKYPGRGISIYESL
jgi:hypothetical protein